MSDLQDMGAAVCEAARRDHKRLSSSERRLAILDAAKELFLTKGYAAASLEEIVAMSGGSLSTVYQLFGNKQGLWEALVEQACAQVTAPLHDAMNHQGDPRTVLKAFASRLDALERSRETAGALRLMLAEGGKYPELAKTLFANGPDAGKHIVSAYLDSEVAAGRLAIADTNVAAEQFRALVCSDTKLRNACGVLAHLSADEISKRLDIAVDMFLKVYGA
jgi:TetR/AcrR family transcriptional regulator, mexJK operon transcriptional repressor